MVFAWDCEEQLFPVCYMPLWFKMARKEKSCIESDLESFSSNADGTPLNIHQYLWLKWCNYPVMYADYRELSKDFYSKAFYTNNWRREK